MKNDPALPAHYADIQLVGLGWEVSDPTRILQSFVREHYRVHYVTRGAGWLETKQQTYRLTEGTGFVIFPGEATHYYPDPADPWEYFWIGAKGGSMDALVRFAGLTRAAPIYQITNTQEQARQNIAALCASIVDAPHCAHSTPFYVYSLLSHARPFVKARHSNSYYFEMCLQYIHQNYMEQISIGDLAAHFAIDRTYLFKLFKKNINCSPRAYLISHRISKACDQLVSTERSISEIAYGVGFNDLADFSKQFKKLTGMTATKFREVSEQKNNCSEGVYF